MRKFNDQEFQHFHALFQADADTTLFSKMEDYADSEDQLQNFRVAAEFLGLTPLQIWAVYFYKHVASIMTLARTGRLESEPARGRFEDLYNYSVLGAAIEEASRNTSVQKVEPTELHSEGITERDLYPEQSPVGQRTAGQERRKGDIKTPGCGARASRSN